MFTGIIEEIGQLDKIKAAKEGKELQIRCSKVIEDMKVGESLAVNGICFTILEARENQVKVFASAETLDKTTVIYWQAGEYVNLERPLKLSGRLDGHLVLGHIDFAGKVIGIKKQGQSTVIRIEYPSQMARYFIPKGSVAVDGISLTISALGAGYFENTIIPFTWENTNLKSLTHGKRVNIEADVIGKYVERYLSTNKQISKGKITEDYLRQQGFKS